MRLGCEGGAADSSASVYVGRMAGLLVTASLVGFLLAVGIYMFSFIRLKAKTSILWSLVSAVSAMGLLATLAHFLVLEYPMGLLQQFIPLPWPFG